ncbi:MAG: phosphatidylserine decarboxylase [bacterium]
MDREARRPPIAREGWGFVAGLLLLAAFSAALGGWTWAGLFLLLGCGVAAFFRDPDRKAPEDPRAVAAPADGRVVAIDPGEAGGRIIRIFLSVFNVHINRSPVSGVIRATRHREGKFLAAFRESASRVNEQNTLDISTPSGENFRVVQIAGLLARRIVCWVKEGDPLRAGDRIGLIQFGSRTDLHLPPGYEVLVEVGSKVRGGETIVARPTQG